MNLNPESIAVALVVFGMLGGFLNDIGTKLAGSKNGKLARFGQVMRLIGFDVLGIVEAVRGVRK